MTRLRIPYALLPLFLLASGLSGQRVITTVAGTDFIFPTEATPGLNAPLGRLSALAADSAGNIYMADESNHLVLKYDTAGNITVFAGNGLPAFSGDGGYARNASLNAPRGVATDSLGNVYIADTQNFRVRKVTPDGIITTIAGNGVDAYAGENTPAVQASIAEPLDVATDKQGNVFVTDHSPRVRKISAAGTITTVAGNGVTGFSGDGGPATAAAFNIPIALAVDANDNLYISDWQNNRIRRVTPDGIVRTFAGTGDDAYFTKFVDGVPALQATFARPRQLSVGPDGSIYVVDQGINRVRRIAPNGIVTTVAGAGGADLAGDGGPATKAQFDQPSAGTVDRFGNLYIGDTEHLRLRKVTPDQIVNSVAGNGALRASPNGGLAASAVLNTPRGIGLDRTGHVFFTNTNDHRVLELIDSYLYIVAGNGIRGGGDGLPAAQVGLNFPVGLAFDSTNNMYIADQYDQLVRKVNAAGILSTVAGPADFGGFGAFPTGLTVDAANNVYIVDRQTARIRKLTPAGTVTFFAGAGNPGYSGDNGPATNARFAFPQGAATDSLGNLYVADTGNNVIRKVAALPPGVPATTVPVITTVAGTGKAGYTGDGGRATAATLSAPEGIWVDRAGAIYIADTGNNVIRQIAPDGIISTFAGTGQGAFFGDGGDPAAAALYNPSGIVGDGAGAFYIVDKSNNRIRSVTGRTPQFEADQSALNFTAVAGAGSPGAQTVNLECEVNGVAYTVSSDSPWLSVSPAAGTIPAALRVNVDPSSLAVGNYHGTVIIKAPLANPPAQMISVGLTLAAPTPPKLAPQPNAITLSTPEDASPAQQTMFVANVGSGALTFDASPSSEKGWLKTSVSVNTAVPSAPGTVIVTADPAGLGAGTYTGAVNVTSPTTGETAAVPVTLAVTPSNRPKLVVSQTGLSFQGITCAGSDPSCRPAFAQCFAALNAGQGTFDVSVTTDVPWLKAQKLPCPRPSVSSVSSVPEVVVQPVTALGPGKYEGNVIVTAAQADNSPQTVHVVFTVSPLGAKLPPAVDPQGLVFIGTPTQTPGALDANLTNYASPTFHFSATPAFDAGASNWFTGGPQSGSVDNGKSSPVRVYPNFSGLAPGAYTGRVTLKTDYGTQTVEVVAQVTGSLGAAGATARAVQTCTATQLNAIFTSVAPDFNAQAGLPFRVELYLVDDCGNPLTSGTAVASFNNGDTAVNLISLLNGVWSGTWIPSNVPGSNRVEIRVRARSADSSIAGEVARSGNLQ